MFRIGDKVTGKPNNRYVITTDEATLCVVTVCGDLMQVRLLSHKNPGMAGKVGTVYRVQSNGFVKANVFKGNK